MRREQASAKVRPEGLPGYMTTKVNALWGDPRPAPAPIERFGAIPPYAPPAGPATMGTPGRFPLPERAPAAPSEPVDLSGPPPGADVLTSTQQRFHGIDRTSGLPAELAAPKSSPRFKQISSGGAGNQAAPRYGLDKFPPGSPMPDMPEGTNPYSQTARDRDIWAYNNPTVDPTKQHPALTSYVKDRDGAWRNPGHTIEDLVNLAKGRDPNYGMAVSLSEENAWDFGDLETYKNREAVVARRLAQLRGEIPLVSPHLGPERPPPPNRMDLLEPRSATPPALTTGGDAGRFKDMPFPAPKDPSAPKSWQFDDPGTQIQSVPYSFLQGLTTDRPPQRTSLHPAPAQIEEFGRDHKFDEFLEFIDNEATQDGRFDTGPLPDPYAKDRGMDVANDLVNQGRFEEAKAMAQAGVDGSRKKSPATLDALDELLKLFAKKKE